MWVVSLHKTGVTIVYIKTMGSYGDLVPLMYNVWHVLSVKPQKQREWKTSTCEATEPLFIAPSLRYNYSDPVAGNQHQMIKARIE